MSNKAVLRSAVQSVVDTANAYLPPGGISKEDFIRRTLLAIDNPAINAAMAEQNDSSGQKLADAHSNPNPNRSE